MAQDFGGRLWIVLGAAAKKSRVSAADVFIEPGVFELIVDWILGDNLATGTFDKETGVAILTLTSEGRWWLDHPGKY